MAENNLRSRILNSLADAKQIHGTNLLYWSSSDAFLTGVPDTNVLYYGVPAYIEFKADDGTLSERQALWLHQMQMAGAVAFVIRAYHSGPLKAAYAPVGGEYQILPEDWLDSVVRARHIISPNLPLTT